MATFWKFYDRLEMGLALAAMLAMVVAVLTAALGRVVGAPVASAPQFAQLFLIWTVMLGADMTVKTGDHIRVTALPDMIPDGGKRILAAICLTLTFVFLAFLFWKGIELSAGNWQRPLATSGLSYGLVTLALPVGAILIAISLARRIWASGLIKTFEPDDSEHEAIL